jgi:hypothetical protein
MRTPMFAALAAVAVMFVAGGAPSAAGISRHASPPVRHDRSPLWELLRKQESGALPAPMPHAAMKSLLAELRAHPRLHPSVGDAKGQAKAVGLWLSDTYYDYLIGMKGRTALTAISTSASGCNYPLGLKVDDAQNLWVACEYNAAFTYGAVQEYAAGTLVNTYNEGCVPSGCTFYGYAFDTGTDAKGHVFATNPFVQICTPSCTQSGAILWWNVSSPSSTPTPILIPQSPSNFVEPYYMDVDTSGNVWFDYFGEVCNTSCVQGYGLGEIQTPTTTPTFVSVLPPGTFEYGGGVYVSNGGTVLNVIDQNTRLVNQYSLPLLASLGSLGPTKQNLLGMGDPVAGGFNGGDTQLAIADSANWLDVGKVSSNSFKQLTNVNIVEPQGAAYVPSDK